jgi:hypothetical protein
MDLEGMDLTRFHKVREGVKSNAAPGSAGERAAAEALVRSALEATPGFLHVEVERTDDPDRLVIAMCSYSPDLSTSDTAAALLGLWLHQVSYPFWEAHGLVVDEHQVELQAATRGSSTGRYLTVHVLARRSAVPEQRTAPD